MRFTIHIERGFLGIMPKPDGATLVRGPCDGNLLTKVNKLQYKGLVSGQGQVLQYNIVEANGGKKREGRAFEKCSHEQMVVRGPFILRAHPSKSGNV